VIEPSPHKSGRESHGSHPSKLASANQQTGVFGSRDRLADEAEVGVFARHRLADRRHGKGVQLTANRPEIQPFCEPPGVLLHARPWEILILSCSNAIICSMCNA
jgi:hypothetical protein